MRAILGALMSTCLMAAPALAADAIATTDGEAAGLSLQVTQLKVSNGTVMLRFTIASDGPAQLANDNLTDQTVDKPDHYSVSGVYLLDTANKKKYLVIYDTENHCVCSRGIDYVRPKESQNLWAKFPAPPDSVTKIGIVVPHFVPMDDVPLSR